MRQLANWFRRKKLHLDRRLADLERSGLPTVEARRQAMLELDGIARTQEEVRDVWLARWLRDFAYDLRFSARSFRRTPSFTITAVLSLMLGIGASTAIYSLVDQVLLHAPPVRQPQHLVLIDWKGDQVANGFGSWNLMSYPICRDLDQQGSFLRAYSAARSRPSISRPVRILAPRLRKLSPATTSRSWAWSRPWGGFSPALTTALQMPTR